jgi:hypothetical protein
MRTSDTFIVLSLATAVLAVPLAARLQSEVSRQFGLHDSSQRSILGAPSSLVVSSILTNKGPY